MKTSKKFLISGVALCFAAVVAAPAPAQTPAMTALSSLQIELGEQGWGTPGRNVSVGDGPLMIAGQRFAKGVGTHAPAEMWIATNGATRFRAQVGLDDEATADGSVEFSLESDGKTLWKSGVMKRGDAAKTVDLDLTGIKTLVLRVGEAGDGNSNDHADWADAMFEGGSPKIISHAPAAKLDTRGQLIQAHGGGILRRGNTYYWYGENKLQGAGNAVGISGYQSKDLVNWEPMGVVMPASGFPEKYRAQGVVERPKVIYNAKTGKYVMWAHLDADNYKAAEAGVCVADQPQGPFQFVRSFRPVATSTFRDMNLFVDDDGAAYVFYAGEDNSTMHVMRLSDDYQNVATPLEEGKNWARILVKEYREAPAPFKVGARYYLLTSGLSGWSPNAASYATADSILGPWKTQGNPFVGPDANVTFRSQPTFVLPNPNGKKGEFIYMGDRWNPGDLANSRYIWLPFTVKDDGSFEVRWQNDWKPN